MIVPGTHREVQELTSHLLETFQSDKSEDEAYDPERQDTTRAAWQVERKMDKKALSPRERKALGFREGLPCVPRKQGRSKWYVAFPAPANLSCRFAPRKTSCPKRQGVKGTGWEGRRSREPQINTLDGRKPRPPLGSSDLCYQQHWAACSFEPLASRRCWTDGFLVALWQDRSWYEPHSAEERAKWGAGT